MLHILFLLTSSLVANVSFAMAQLSITPDLFSSIGGWAGTTLATTLPYNNLGAGDVVHTPSPTVDTVLQATTTIDYESPYTSLYSGPAVVKKEVFGTVYSALIRLDSYEKAVAPVASAAMRWPDSELVKNNAQLYSFTHDDLFKEPAVGDAQYDAEFQKGLTDVMAYAVAHNQSLVVALPIAPYLTRVPQGQAAVRKFVSQLLSGKYGPLPTSLTLEIGNVATETSPATGVGSYGYLANALVESINTVVANTTLNTEQKMIDVAIAIGATPAEQKNIFTQISSENLRTIDGFIHEAGKVSTGDDYQFAEHNKNVAVVAEYWKLAWSGRPVPEMRMLATDWNVGGKELTSLEDLIHTHDVGIKQARGVIEVMSKLIAGGIDSATLDGVHARSSAMLWHTGQTVSFGGQAFKLMAESLVGTQLLAGTVDDKGIWQAESTMYDVVGYKDNARLILFLTAREIPDSGLDVSIVLNNIGAVANALATTLTATADGQPELTESSLIVAENSITYHFTHDYEVARIIIER